TEHLAYDQAVTTCRLLVSPVLGQQHLNLIKNELQNAAPPRQFGNLDHVVLKEPGKEYQYHFLSDKFDDSFERELYKEFRSGEGKTEDHRQRPSDQVLLYYAPIRAANECLGCHQAIAKEKKKDALSENDLLAMVRIRMPTKTIEE